MRTETSRELAEPLWSTELPGVTAHSVAIDAREGLVYASDGWGVSYASLSVRALSLESGELVSRQRTGHQSVGAILPRDDGVWLALDKRLERRAAGSLAVLDTSADRWPRYTQSLAGRGRFMVAANWLKPRVAIVDTTTGGHTLATAGKQPCVFETPDGVVALSAIDGGLRRLGPVKGTFGKALPWPRATTGVTVGGEMWWVQAGEWDEEQNGMAPISRRAGSELRVGADGGQAIALAGPVGSLTAHGGDIWVTGQYGSYLQTVRTAERRADAALEFPGVARWVALDPSLGIGLATLNGEGSAILSAYALPGVVT